MGPCCMHNVFKVDPSIWGVKLRRSNQVELEIHPALGVFGGLVCNPHVFDRPPSPVHPLVTLDVLPAAFFEPSPGGGPRPDLFIGAPQSSDVTAVGGGAESPHVFLALIKIKYSKILFLFNKNYF